MSGWQQINAFKSALILTIVGLLFSGIVVVNLGFNVRPIHFILPVLLVVGGVGFRSIGISAKYILKTTTARIFLIYLCLMVYGIQDTEGYRLFLAITFNVLLGTIIYTLARSKSINAGFYLKLSYYSVLFLSGVIIIQFVMSMAGLYQPHMFGRDGFFLLGRPAAFLGDPGWLAYWLILFGLMAFYFRRVGKVNWSSFLLFIGLLLLGVLINQSRVTLFFLLVNYYLIVLHKRRERKYFLIICVSVLILVLGVFLYAGLISLPENLYYDIISLRANPRIYDATLIFKEYIDSGNVWMGNGLGSLDRLKEIYPWREFTQAHNVLPLQVLNDSGIVGFVLVVLMVFKLYRSLKTRIVHILYAEFLILLCFHNIFPYFQLFWFILPILFSFDRILEENRS